MGAQRYAASGAATEGMLQGIYFLVWAIGSLILGPFADRYGRTRGLMLSCFLYVLGALGIAATHSLGGLLAFRVIGALGAGGVWGACFALVTESGARPSATNAAIIQTAISVGHLFVASLNWMLHGVSWRWLFVGVAALGVLSWVLISRTSSRRDPVPRKGRFEWRLLGWGVLLGFVGVAGSVHVGFWLPNLIASLSALGDLRVATSWSVLCLQTGGIAGILASAWLIRQLGSRRAFLLYSIGAGCSIALAPMVSSTLPQALGWAAVMGFWATGYTGLLAATLPGLYPRDKRALLAGAAYNVGRFATAAQLASLGFVMAHLGPRAGYASGAWLYVAAILPLLVSGTQALQRSGDDEPAGS